MDPSRSKPLDRPCEIAIVGEALAGFGDYIAVGKIQKFLNETLGGVVPRKNIKVYMDASSEAQKVFKDIKFRPLSEASKHRPDLVVVVIGREELNVRFQRNFEKKVPSVYWNELSAQPIIPYGDDEAHLQNGIPYSSVNMGLCPHEELALGVLFQNPEEGIFFDEELVEWSEKRRTSEEKLEALSGTSEGVQEAILGEKYSRKKAVEFSATTRLFSGYTNEHDIEKSRGESGAPSAVTYLLALSEMQKKLVQGLPDSSIESKGDEVTSIEMEDQRPKDMTVFLMGEHDLLAETEHGVDSSSPKTPSRQLGKEPDRGHECMHSSLLQAHVQRELLENGINKIEIFRYDKKLGAFSTGKYLDLEFLHPDVVSSVKLEDRRTMRVITGNISHDDSIGLTKASEDEVVTTGDGSLSEALSARKSIMYQVYPHKQKLAEGLTALFKDVHLHELGKDGNFVPVKLSSDSLELPPDLDDDLSYDSDGYLSDEEVDELPVEKTPGEIFYSRRIHRKEHREECDKVISTFDIKKNVASRIKEIVTKTIAGELPPIYKKE